MSSHFSPPRDNKTVRFSLKCKSSSPADFKEANIDKESQEPVPENWDGITKTTGDQIQVSFQDQRAAFTDLKRSGSAEHEEDHKYWYFFIC